MRVRLIALSANGRQAGKDTAADFIEEYAKEQGLSVHRTAFADLGKQLAGLALMGVTDLDTIDEFKLHGEITSTLAGLENTMDGRDYLIKLMNGARTLFGDNFWTMQVLPRPWDPTADLTIITDLRFPIEATRVVECGGFIIKILRKNAEQGESEEMGAPYHLAINNDGDLPSLAAALRTALDKH